MTPTQGVLHDAPNRIPFYDTDSMTGPDAMTLPPSISKNPLLYVYVDMISCLPLFPRPEMAEVWGNIPPPPTPFWPLPHPLHFPTPGGRAGFIFELELIFKYQRCIVA